MFPAREREKKRVFTSVLTQKGNTVRQKCSSRQRHYCKPGYSKVKRGRFVTTAVSIHVLSLYRRERQMCCICRWRAVRMQCVGGWVGRGMTIGFRERAIWTDGPPKIPLRKMAGLTYFGTRRVVQRYCTEIGQISTIMVIILSIFVGHYRIMYVVHVSVTQESIRRDANAA